MRVFAASCVVVALAAVVSSLQTDSRVRPVDQRFDDRFWRQLQYGQFDQDIDLHSWRPGLWDGSPDPYGRDRFRMPDVFIETPNAPPGAVLYIVRHLPGVWLEMTGQPFTGRIQRGHWVYDYRPHTIAVRFEYGSALADLPASAPTPTVGPDPARPTLHRGGPWTGGMAHLFAHELGHALGVLPRP